MGEARPAVAEWVGIGAEEVVQLRDGCGRVHALCSVDEPRDEGDVAHEQSARAYAAAAHASGLAEPRTHLGTHLWHRDINAK